MKKIASSIESSAIAPLYNLLSGIFIKISNPFKKGDFIEIDGQLGSVKKRGIQKTIIANLDGSFTMVDNGRFYQGDLHNLSTKNIIRLAFTIELCYNTDMSRAKEAINQFLANDERILRKPLPKLQVVKLKEKYVEISIQPWCLLDQYMELDHELEDQLKSHLLGLGYEVKTDESLYENLGFTA